MPWPLSSSSILIYVLTIKIENIKIQCGIEGNMMKKECSEDAVAKQ